MRGFRFLWVMVAAVSVLVLGGISFPADMPRLSSPARGTLNTRPAASWEDGLLCGNGNLGAIVMGDPLDETIIFSHGRLFLPWEKPLPPVNTAAHLGEIRTLLADGKYQQAADLVVELSKREGYDRKRWTDPLVPAFDLRIAMNANGPVREYARTLDFSNGLASVRWQDDAGTFLRRMFVSRADDAAVLSLQSTAKGGIRCRIRLATRPSSAKPGMDADYWNPEDKFKSGVQETVTDASGPWLMYRSRFKKSWPGGLQGYEGVAGVFSRNGLVSAQNGEIAVEGAGEVWVIVKLAILTNYAQSGIRDMQRRVERLARAGFSALLARHARLHGDIFNRVHLDLGGGPDRDLPVDQLQAKSKIGNLNLALLEKEFDKARYVTLSASGDYPPALQGIWTGTWGPPWSGDYTQNGNVQSAIAGELSGNMAECMLSYFNYMDSMLPDFRETARRLFGTRGIHVPSRMSTHGLNNHFDRTWPMTFWTAGAAWAAHFYYDYWLYTHDRDFLVRRALPFMKEAALFYEDFLFEGPDGKYVFSPSFSPENAPGNSKSQAAVNATMDISLARELLTNLVAVCREIGVERDGVERWTRMLAKLPDYRINADGAVKEWSWDGLDDDYQHRHNSHLVAIFDGVPADVAGNPRLLQAFRKALQLRMQHRRGQPYREMAFGLVQLGLAATSLRDAETAYEIVDWLANDYWTPALNSTHEPKKLFNVDITGGLPAVVIKMLLFSEPGRIDLLPALPAVWTRGRVEGLPCRGQLLVKELSWDEGKIHAVLRSPRAQSALLTVPGRIAGFRIVGGSAGDQGDGTERRTISLPSGKDVIIDITLHQQYAAGANSPLYRILSIHRRFGAKT